jgi:hypothetical protein
VIVVGCPLVSGLNDAFRGIPQLAIDRQGSSWQISGKEGGGEEGGGEGGCMEMMKDFMQGDGLYRPMIDCRMLFPREQAGMMGKEDGRMAGVGFERGRAETDAENASSDASWLLIDLWSWWVTVDVDSDR